MINETLSEQGLARRQQILQLARGEARRRRRRRLAGRGGIALVIFAMACSLTLLRRPQTVATRQPSPNTRMTPPPASQPVLAVQYVSTDPTITDRLTIQPGPPTWTSIDDHELLTELAAAGQPAGIVSVHGKTMLLMR